MINSKERAKLRSLAQSLKPVVWVGKDGFTKDVYETIGKELFDRELIKISLNPSQDKPTMDEMAEIATKLSCEVVACIGKKLILYKQSSKQGVKHIL